MKIALVIPWFDRSLKGGAEQQAWQIASRLAEREYEIDVLTTCGKSFLADWDTDFYPPGITKINHYFRIIRFPLRRRDRARFDHACQQLLKVDRSSLLPGVNPVSAEIAEDFCRQNIDSAELHSYLQHAVSDYDYFLFLPYLYGPILNGLPLVQEKALLQPCLHDESYAYLPQVEKLFRCSRKILFNSVGEFHLALRLYGPGIFLKSLVVGEGVELNKEEPGRDDHGFLPAGCHPFRFFLWAGRRDRTKNVHLLCRTFRRFRHVYSSDLHLILIGPGEESFADPDNAIHDLGLVAESRKNWLMQHCLALVNPSENESYSRVIMEAWRLGRPVVVHRNCLATAMAVETSGGGWLAGPDDEWVQRFSRLADLESEKLITVGRLGEEYANRYSDWDRVIDRYERLFMGSEIEPEDEEKYVGQSIHQVLPNLSYGDAISNHARAIRNYLRAHGADSRIFARHIHEKVLHECEVFDPKKLNPEDVILYHHSIGSEVTEKICQHKGAKLLVYHNITPADFFSSYSPVSAQLLRQGRKDLARLPAYFSYSGGDSKYNCQELVDVGFQEPAHLPLVLDPSIWNFPADVELMRSLQDGRKNILFTGRIAPNKCQHDLIGLMPWLIELNSDIRLVLVGGYSPSDLYYQELCGRIKSLGLKEWVHLTGHVGEEKLQAYFRTAHLYWSMSEHEGFGVPLIEAMWFDVPVFAYKSTAVPETLGNAGLMFTQKNNPAALAAVANQLLTDDELRQKVLIAQRKRREELLPQQAFAALDKILRNMLDT